MEKGTVNNDLEPIIELSLLSGGNSVKAKAVIDTGFNGYISIPLRLFSALNWKFVGYEKYEIASGEIVEEKIYLGQVLFNDKRHLARALISRTKDVLIGTRLLSGQVLTIDFTNKTVLIE